MSNQTRLGFAVSGFAISLVALASAVASCAVQSDPATVADVDGGANGATSSPSTDVKGLPLGAGAKLVGGTEIPGVLAATRNVTFDFDARPAGPWRYVPYPHEGPLRRPAHDPNLLFDPKSKLLDPDFLKPAPLPDAPPPPLAANFDALDDNNTSIPPDTNGAAGPNHLFVTLNTQIRIQTKAGATVSTSDLNTFFASLGHASVFDPHISYDSLSGRWVFVAVADPQGPQSAITLAVSQTSDPTGTWNLYDTLINSAGNWADFPLMGFNKNWVVVTVNIFNDAGTAFMGCEVYAYDKAALYAGAPTTPTKFTTPTAPPPALVHFAMSPAVTYDPILATEYILEEWDGASGTEALSTITGPVGAPVFTTGTTFPLPTGTWDDQATVAAPQQGSVRTIDSGDARMRTVVYRNGALWATHMINLPATTPTRNSNQWYEVNPSGPTVLQAGRIDDPTGAQFFAYPSLAVNKNGDAFFGYSRFSSTQFAGADYTMRFPWDPLNTLRTDTVYKAGLASYYKTFGGPRNRWGDYSNTVVDPADDATMWTVQEYATTKSGGFDHWGTWWAEMTVDCGGKPNGTACDDGNLCTTGPKTCQAGVCVGTAVTCTAIDQCHDVGVCNTGTGICSTPTKANGSTCNDGNSCTQTDTCQAGVCTGSNPVVCTASDSCHDVGVCNAGTGVCSNPVKANGTTCTGSNLCNQTNTCQAGVCAGSNPVVCTASDQCHDPGTCNPGTGTCSNPTKANGTTCTGSSLCNQTNTCQAGVCAGSNPVVCTASDQCHDVGTCNPGTGACSNPVKANGASCTGSNLCNQTNTCQAGVCAGSNPVVCTASDQCHDPGACNPGTGTCSNPTKSNGSFCDDANQCTLVDTCQAGTCTGANPVTCTASDQCHAAGVCNTSTGICSNPAKPDGSTCTGSNLCNQANTCQAGTCTGSNPVVCTASDQCHDVGTCNSGTGTCSNPVKANGSTCNDGNGCTQTDVCQGGTCAGSNPVVCTAQDQCHVAGACNPTNGTCSNPAAANGTTCNDGNACTQTDSCQAGTCAGANPITCVAADQCHVAGTCDPTSGVCSNPNQSDGTGCNDGNACTLVDGCIAGICTGTSPVTCAASDQCHVAGTCDPTSGTCSNPNAANGTTCNDGNGCTQTDVCAAGACTGSNPVTCTAKDQCHAAGTCDPTSGTCSNPNKSDGTTCDDGNQCTQTDTCTAGTCTGASPVTCSAKDDCHVAGTCDPTSGTCSNPSAADGTPCKNGGVCGGGSCVPATNADAGGDGGGGRDAGHVDSGGGGDSGAQADGASAGDGGNGADQISGSASGCGCRVAGTREGATPAALGFGVLAMIGLGRARRRRRAA